MRAGSVTGSLRASSVFISHDRVFHVQRNFRIRLINPHSFSVNRRKDDFMQLNECFVALSKPDYPVSLLKN